MANIKLGKYYTAGGKPVRVICVDRKGTQPVVALIECNGYEIIDTYWSDGRKSLKEDGIDDLIIHAK